MTADRTRIGFIGCGNISDTYFRVARSFDQLEVVACADHSLERARAQAAKYGLPRLAPRTSCWPTPKSR